VASVGVVPFDHRTSGSPPVSGRRDLATATWHDLVDQDPALRA
jgi:hypothetical protein